MLKMRLKPTATTARSKPATTLLNTNCSNIFQAKVTEAGFLRFSALKLIILAENVEFAYDAKVFAYDYLLFHENEIVM
ncbi:MAG: hypothetical protein IPK08_19835 [Bacteroidetes bacterium]|nr:hypothetical protein [Bacteroidota bacterium]